ncbi:hypothetical protein K493DRAFT_76612 [Basidiobolus meristosporus CBS 931.73]|uniref:Uncharacterized protein n=1 Tax=Basidiobolus meristosporus CBS 931.73 TaxID=1314790 RepID=A0A1Y1XSG9_9FUNG|nr:hypothetical protein K493DRAFT_76612 [Basidiobolus meristosporus CBS 931.73]|eukprot:ORX88673.1 hypothetical protein K493DRAFT_76612 [Basidiobolus meristosporus CBS 931.73]
MSALLAVSFAHYRGTLPPQPMTQQAQRLGQWLCLGCISSDTLVINYREALGVKEVNDHSRCTPCIDHRKWAGSG